MEQKSRILKRLQIRHIENSFYNTDAQKEAEAEFEGVKRNTAIYCPECGGEMIYDLNIKLYTCKSCGVTMKYHEILDAKAKLRPKAEGDERRRQERRDYLKWWLTKKEK